MTIKSKSTLRTLIMGGRAGRALEKALLFFLDSAGSLESGVIQALSGPGAINLTSFMTEITSTGADAFTLADGYLGQKKLVRFIVDGGDATITPANLNGGTTVVLSVVGDAVLFEMNDTGWTAVDLDSLLKTGATPVLA